MWSKYLEREDSKIVGKLRSMTIDFHLLLEVDTYTWSYIFFIEYKLLLVPILFQH